MRTAGDWLKELGIADVSANNVEFLASVRNVARTIIASNGSVTSDDLRLWANLNDIAPTHPNAWGAVFHGGEWKHLGYVKSQIPSNHSRVIGIWCLK